MTKQLKLWHSLKSYDIQADKILFDSACKFSKDAHQTQIRESGDPYYSHPLEVASILTEIKLDIYSIITALLHDTVEDTSVTIEEIEKNFGSEIAHLVDGVTKLTRLELQSEATKQAENFRKLVLAMSSDIRVLLVKLADRLHNMRTLHFTKDPEKRRRKARETMEIYAPLAERMGMQKMKEELQDLAFSEINPEIYASIKNRLKFLHRSSENTISVIIENLKNITHQAGLNCKIYGRVKTAYSIWKKMQKKNISFEQLSDIMAFRLIVSSLSECYQALGFIHSNFHVVPGRFKDYISTPKSNNYQSLHTGVIGPLNQRIEIQIRTQEMNQISEIGVAAHWGYKQGKNIHDGKQYAWLRSLLEILEQASGPEEFLEHTKLEMFQDNVYCFTPKGELIALPRSATPIDFAYAIHSTMGDRTIGAKINGRQMPLRTTLQNGDQVEILTANNQSPSPTWEKFVVTGKARARIRRFIRTQQKEQFSELGKSILHKICIKEKVIYSEKALIGVLEKFQYQFIDDLFAAIGEGIQSPREIIQAAYPESINKKELSLETYSKVKKRSNLKNNNYKNAFEESVCIKGLIPGMAVHYAGCCHPLPGDNIIGIVTTGKGVTIHTNDCEGIPSHTAPEQILDLSWEDHQHQDARYIGRLKVIFLNKAGSLAGMTTTISKNGGNIINLKITNRSADFWDLLVDIEVKDIYHLQDIKAALRTVSIITYVERI